MGAISSQNTSLAIVDSTVDSGADQRKKSKLRVTSLWEGNSPGTGEFSAQMAINAVKMFPFDDVIMTYTLGQNGGNITDFVHMLVLTYFQRHNNFINFRVIWNDVTKL